MAASLARLTLFALISAFEQDLRETLRVFAANSTSPSSFFGNELLGTTISRSGAESIDADSTPDAQILLAFVDFGDLFSLSRRHTPALPERLIAQLKRLGPQLESLIAIRNRVMHSRPLEFDDLAQTAELTTTLLQERQFWPQLEQMKLDLETTPERVLQLQLPSTREPTNLLHNLPLPDFDETGFIGRKTALANLVKACLGVYPVISVVGEGGLGKTSLALKAAYEILDKKGSPFDAIIFVTAKATQLTTTEISRIKGAINSSLGLFQTAVKTFGGDGENPISELNELLRTFRILLIIDNLETVLDNHLRSVLEDLPSGSKILITTRIGLGAFEFPVKLEPLGESEAVQLLRATADVRGCIRLTRVPNERLANFCKRMRNNPLHIKWFVSAVQIGKRPEEVLADDRMFLQFCLANVFEQLTQNARSVVRTLLALGGSYTVAELAFLTGGDLSPAGDDSLLKAVGELMRTNMFLMNSSYLGNTFESRYELSQLARAYLTKFYPAGKDAQVRLTKLKNQLIAAGEGQKGAVQSNPLSPYTIHARSRSDWVIAKMLRDSLMRAKEGEFDEALRLIERAKLLAPDFYECFRVEGWINALMGNASQAYDSYERAIETEPNAANVRMMFAGFLIRDLHDAEQGGVHFKEAMRLAPDLPEPKLEYARCCLYNKQFDEADALLSDLANIPNCHERVARKIVDLRLQTHSRRAEYFASNQEPLKALACLEKLQQFFSSISTPDGKMYERLSWGRRVASTVRNSFGFDPGSTSRTAAVIKWIDETVASAPSSARSQEITQDLDLWEKGTIVRLHQTNKFGFIRSFGSEEFFFHISSVSDASIELKVGTAVRFRLSIDYMNRPKATDVQRLDSA